jgi:putative thioredoxin
MADPTTVKDVRDADFERAVLEESRRRPVVVDFWAPWCGPCRTLGPLLERLAQEARGGFLLAKVNVDESPQVAQAFQIRSIPAVIAFRDGRIVSEFVGAQPEPQVRRFVEALLPTEADRLVAEADDLAAKGHANAAEERYRGALAKSAHHGPALVGLARVLADRGAADEALSLLERVTGTPELEAEAERLAAELRTRAAAPAAGGADEAALRARLDADPRDLAARIDLGRLLAARRAYEDALGEWIAAVRQDPKFDDEAARKAILDVFSLLGPEHALTQRFRSELARALFR